MSSVATALVVLVPEADPIVGEFRQRYDPSAVDGMTAHITIRYPFLPAGMIESWVVDALTAAVGSRRRFSCTLSRTQIFPGVLYLAPEPAQPFIDLAQSVEERFAENLSSTGGPGDYIPHLTIANTGDPHSIDGILQGFRQAHSSGILIRSEVGAVSLMAKRAGRWREETKFALE